MPVVLKPGQVKLLRIGIPNVLFENVADRAESLLVQFHVFSSRGAQFLPHKSISPLGKERDLPADTWAPFSLGAMEQ